MKQTDEPTSPPAIARPDNVWLRCLLHIPLGLFITLSISNEHSTSGSAIPTWMIPGTLYAGIAASLLYMGDILLLRIHTRMSEWLALMCVFGLGLILVCQSTALIGGVAYEPAKSDAHTLIFLMVTLLAVLTRGLVAARVAAPYLPLNFAELVPFGIRSRTTQRVLLPIPSRWIYVLYFLSPLAWWAILLWAVIVTRIGFGAPIMGVILFPLALIVGARLLVGLASYVEAFREWREAGVAKDGKARRHAGWILTSTGLGVCGLIVFYAFCWATQDVQREVITGVIKIDEQLHIDELNAFESNRAKLNGTDADHYQRAVESLGIVPVSKAVLSEWNGPCAALHIKKIRRELEYFRLASSLGSGGAGGLRVSSANECAQLVMLEARWFAEKGDYKSVLNNAASIFTFGGFFGSQHDWKERCEVDSTCAGGTIAALAWSDAIAPDDRELSLMQKLFCFDTVRRDKDFVFEIQMQTLNSIRKNESSYVEELYFRPDRSPLNLGTWVPVTLLLEHQKACDYYKNVLIRYATGDLESLREDMVDNTTQMKGNWFVIPNEWLPELLNNEMLARCNLRMAETACALMRFRLKYRVWPDDLKQCTPEFISQIPRDPFNPSESLRFDKNPPRIFSSGPDKKYWPQSHGEPSWPDNPLTNEVFQRAGNYVLFLGSREYFKVRNKPKSLGKKVDSNTLSLLISPTLNDRQMALLTLSRMSVDAAPAIPMLIPLTASSDDEERFSAIFILGQIGTTPNDVYVLRALRTAAQDPDDIVQSLARRAIRSIEDR